MLGLTDGKSLAGVSPREQERSASRRRGIAPDGSSAPATHQPCVLPSPHPRVLMWVVSARVLRLQYEGAVPVSLTHSAGGARCCTSPPPLMRSLLLNRASAIHLRPLVGLPLGILDARTVGWHTHLGGKSAGTGNIGIPEDRWYAADGSMLQRPISRVFYLPLITVYSCGSSRREFCVCSMKVLSLRPC